MNNTDTKAVRDIQLREWIELHHHALTALAMSLVGASEAEEVVQNAWLKAYQAMDRFEGRAQPRTWLSRIVLNEARMQLRARRREILFSDTGNDPDDPPDALDHRFGSNGSWRHPPARWHEDSPENLLTGEQLARCLEELFVNMPDAQRALLELRDSAGLGFDEICNELGISASNARVLLHRARARVYQLVDGYEETGEC